MAPSQSPLSDSTKSSTSRDTQATWKARLDYWLPTLKPLMKWSIGLIVVVFLGLTIRRAYNDLVTHAAQLNLGSMQWGWVVGAIFLYAVGMLPAGLCWLQTLKSFGQTVPFWKGLHAYFLGHLGKYVPGKAMVFVIRVGRLHPLGVEVKPTIVSIFVETLTSLATGTVLGCIFLLTQSQQLPSWMVWCAWIALPCAVLFLLPHTFRAVLNVLAKSRIGRMPGSVSKAFTWRLMARTCSWMLLVWLVHGTSAWLMLIGLEPSTDLYSFHAWSACVGSIAIGAAIGFASMIPGGAVVRELVITALLSSLVAQPVALAAAVLFRVGNLIAEMMVIGIVSLTRGWDPKT
jgi:glycosyltransferase 2 family protein